MKEDNESRGELWLIAVFLVLLALVVLRSLRCRPLYVALNPQNIGCLARLLAPDFLFGNRQIGRTLYPRGQDTEICLPDVPVPITRLT